MCPALLLQQLNFGFGICISQRATVMGGGLSSCCSDPAPAIPLQLGVSRAAPRRLENQCGWCPGGNFWVEESAILDSSTAELTVLFKVIYLW